MGEEAVGMVISLTGVEGVAMVTGITGMAAVAVVTGIAKCYWLHGSTNIDVPYV